MLTGTQITYFRICKRKFWLSSNTIDLEHTSELVLEGRFISEHSYQREKHEIRIAGISLDYVDCVNKVVHEIKKSRSLEDAHIEQVKYYLFVLEGLGVSGYSGEINYPEIKKKLKVTLEETDRIVLQNTITAAEEMLKLKTPPPVVKQPACNKCAFYEICFI